MNIVIFKEIMVYGIFVRTISDRKLSELERLLKFYKCFIFTWEEMKRVFKKVIFINDVRVAEVEITKEKIRKNSKRFRELYRKEMRRKNDKHRKDLDEWKIN